MTSFGFKHINEGNKSQDMNMYESLTWMIDVQLE